MIKSIVVLLLLYATEMLAIFTEKEIETYRIYSDMCQFLDIENNSRSGCKLFNFLTFKILHWTASSCSSRKCILVLLLHMRSIPYKSH